MATCVALVSVTVAVAGITGFSKRKSSATGVYPIGLAVAKINGDKRPDAAVVNFQGTNSVQIFRGRGKRAVKLVETIPLPGQPDEIVVTKIDGDKHRDLVIGSLTANGVMILKGKEGFGFGPVQTLPNGDSPRRVAVADFNRDGRPDVAVNRQDTDETVIRLQLPSGDFFAAPAVAANDGTVEAGNFDRDGKPDLVVADRVNDQLLALRGDGDGTFNNNPPFRIPLADGGVRQLATTDLNRDGKQDILALLGGDDPGEVNELVVAKGKGNGRFKAAKSYSVGKNPQGAKAGDVPESFSLGRFNGDKRPDAAVAISYSDNGHSNRVAILRGLKGGAFAKPRYVAGGPAPAQVVAARLNGDRLSDLVITNYRGSDRGRISTRIRSSPQIP